MIEKYSIRTDLALEQKERFEADEVEISGVEIEKNYDEEQESTLTKVVIETENGAKIMKKPVGTYYTLEFPYLTSEDENTQSRIVECISKLLQELVEQEKNREKILVVGLGNRMITPDSIGPSVIEQLNISRHIVKEFGRYALEKEDMHIVSAIVPGVMGQTGMETLEIVKGVVEETQPDLVIVIDALAARNSKRLNRTIQITDTGIHPGSGVGNHRSGLSKETLGIPVIAIGVPTVVDAATIVNDTMENLFVALEQSELLKEVGELLQGYHATEKYELIKKLIAPHLNGMFVTPKDIDETIGRISTIISKALNRLFENGTCA